MINRLNKKSVTRLALIIFVFAFSFGAATVMAQTIDYTPLAPLPGIGDNGPVSNLPQYLVSVFRLAIGLAAALAVIMIMIGGIEYMATANVSGKEGGKEKIKQAILGLLLAIGAWLIMYTVDERLVQFNLTVPTPPAIQGTSDQFSTSTQYYVNINGEEVLVDTFGTGFVMKVIYCYTDLTNTSSVLPLNLENQVFPYDINYNNDNVGSGNHTGYSLSGAMTKCQNTPPKPRTFSGGHENCPTGDTVVRHTIACMDTSN